MAPCQEVMTTAFFSLKRVLGASSSQVPLELLLVLSVTKTTLFSKIPGIYMTWL